MKIKSILFLLIFAAASFSFAYAKPDHPALVKTGVYNAFKVYNASCPIGKVCVKVTTLTEEAWQGSLLLYDRQGKLLFRSEEGFVYGSFEWARWPEAVLDLDGDGSFEVLVTGGEGPNRPQSYSIYKYSDKKLQEDGQYVFALTSGNEYIPQPVDDNNGDITWLSHIKELPSGEIKCNVYRRAPKTNPEKQRDAKIKIIKTGSGATAAFGFKEL